MKKNILTIAYSLLLTTLALSQNTFEGTISYTMDFQGLPPEAAAYMAGAETKTYIKGDKSRAESVTAFSTTIIITDGAAKTQVRLMDAMGQKYMIKTSLDDYKKKYNPDDIKVKLIDETKTIAGYKCKKAEVTMKDKDGKENLVIVWYSDEVPTYKSDFKMFGDIPGMLMEYEIKQQGMTIKFTCKSIVNEKISADKFEIPSGYPETTEEELKKNMQKMGGGK
jgi:GLPGLI family protein